MIKLSSSPLSFRIIVWLASLFAASAASAQSNVRFVGTATYSLNSDNSRVTFSAQSIQNRSTTRTGALRMELWAMQNRIETYGETISGTRMARVALDPINGSSTINNITSGTLTVTLPPSGFWRMYLILSEFTNSPRNEGYTAVDSAMLENVFTRTGGSGQLSNLSVRTSGGTGNDSLIMGFVVGGGTSKDILVRSVGPTLSTFGLGGVMANPQLRIADSKGDALNNDDWGGTADLRATFSRLGAFPLPDNSRDSAIYARFGPGAYTAQTLTTAPGVALVELYDGGGNASIQNGSVRAVAGSGDNTLIVGFSITGQPRTVLIRAIGPTLSAFGLRDAIVDPVLKLFRGSDQLYTNDDWSDDNFFSPNSIQAAGDSVGAFRIPTNSLDAVILVGLQPGSYSVQVSGINNATGVALLELYTVGP